MSTTFYGGETLIAACNVSSSAPVGPAWYPDGSFVANTGFSAIRKTGTGTWELDTDDPVGNGTIPWGQVHAGPADITRSCIVRRIGERTFQVHTTSNGTRTDLDFSVLIHRVGYKPPT